MASSVIHIAVANEINKKLKRKANQLLIGSIAPDISKITGETKLHSHFLDSNDNDIPNIDKFLKKYHSKLHDDFVLGYFIHLYTDYLWFKYFMIEVCNNNYISKLDGTNIKCSGNMLWMYIYNDYTNLNVKLLDEYNLNLKIFYNELPEFNNIIEEIPMHKINLLVDQISRIIQNTKGKKELVFNMDNIKVFIQTSVELILAKLEELNIS